MKQRELKPSYQTPLNQSGKGFIIVLVILAVIAGSAYFAAAHHIVKTSNGIKLYPKKSMAFKDTYVDMTSLSFVQLRHHKDVVSSMADKGDLEYVPGGKVLAKASDAGYKLSDAITKFDNEHQITDSLKKVGRITEEKAKKLEKKLDISGKVDKSREFVKEKANKINKWLDEHDPAKK
jgi:hypothetical protein